MLYKSLLALSLVFSVCLFAGFTSQASANALFTVENVEVDVTADNALNARNQAFEQAQVKAFGVLVERMMSEGGAESYKTPDPMTISTLIKDYEITREKLSSVRYIGNYTFRFKENAVRNLFNKSNQTYTDVQSKPLLILPFYKTGAQTKLWSADNFWIQAWARSKSAGALVPMVVPIGDLEDVRDIGDHESMVYSANNLSNMLKRYKAGEAVIIIATADSHLSMITNNNQPASGSLAIDIYRTDRNVPEHVNQIVLGARNDQTLSQVLDEAVKQTQTFLKKDWKAKTLATAGQTGSINVTVPIRTLNDWAEIQSLLGRVGSVRNITVKSLSPRQAQIQLDYQGDPQRLALALDQADLALTQQGSTPAAFGVTPTYMLQKKSASSYGTYQYQGQVPPPQGNTNPYARTF